MFRGAALRSGPRLSASAVVPGVNRGPLHLRHFRFTRQATAPFLTTRTQLRPGVWLTFLGAFAVASSVGLWQPSELLENVKADQDPTTADTVVDPTTQTVFPRSIVSPSGSSLDFIGSGVRTVSFLSIRVYAVAFYAKKSVSDKARARQQIDEESISALLDDDAEDFAVIITPLRGTGLSHLRDGFARALMSRLKLPQVTGHLSQERISQCNDQINDMKAFFPNRNMPKGSQLTVYLTKPAGSALTFALGDPAQPQAIEVLGTINDPLLARELFLSYFADKSPISEELKRSVFAALHA